MKTAIVIGATGLIGGCLVENLLQENAGFEKVVTLGRRPLEKTHPKLVQHKVDFDNLEPSKEYFQGDVLFCALGTTRAKAGSAEAFRKVDLVYPKKAAKLAKSQGVSSFVLVSSVGADASSSNLYTQTKGELEEALEKMDFEQLHILQPSMLLGDRQEFRPLEVFGGAIMQLFSPILGKYTPVAAEKVAKMMVQVSKNKTKENFVRRYSSDTIKNAAK